MKSQTELSPEEALRLFNAAFTVHERRCTFTGVNLDRRNSVYIRWENDHGETVYEMLVGFRTWDVYQEQARAKYGEPTAVIRASDLAGYKKQRFARLSTPKLEPDYKVDLRKYDPKAVFLFH